MGWTWKQIGPLSKAPGSLVSVVLNALFEITFDVIYIHLALITSPSVINPLRRWT